MICTVHFFGSRGHPTSTLRGFFMHTRLLAAGSLAALLLSTSAHAQQGRALNTTAMQEAANEDHVRALATRATPMEQRLGKLPAATLSKAAPLPSQGPAKIVPGAAPQIKSEASTRAIKSH